MAGTNATHEQHARAVIVFQIVDIGLKTPGIGDANASTCTCLGGYDDTLLYCRWRRARPAEPEQSLSSF